jgi:hypothetical protein
MNQKTRSELLAGWVQATEELRRRDHARRAGGWTPEELSALLGAPPHPRELENRPPGSQGGATIIDDPPAPPVSPEAQRAAEEWARDYLGRGCPPGEGRSRLREVPETFEVSPGWRPRIRGGW